MTSKAKAFEPMSYRQWVARNPDMLVCDSCNGTGLINGYRCANCDGSGQESAQIKYQEQQQRDKRTKKRWKQFYPTAYREATRETDQ